MTNVFTGKEFAKRLAEGTFKEPIVRVGMVKKHDDAGTILFTESGECEHWLEVPVGQIEQVTFLTNVSCRDHQHPLVMIQFREPEANNEAATIFAALARRAGQPSPLPPGSTAPGMIDLRPGGGGLGNTPTDLPCLSWTIKCGWKSLYVKGWKYNIPIYVCWKECEIYAPGNTSID